MLPLADKNLLASNRQLHSKNLMLTESVLLLLQNKNPTLVNEYMNSFLLHRKRLDWLHPKNKFKEAVVVNKKLKSEM
jgi:hypothetical protein